MYKNRFIPLNNWLSFHIFSAWNTLYIRSKKRGVDIPIYFNIYIVEKLEAIIMDYCLLQFDALKIFLGVCLLGGSLPNFNFFNVPLPPNETVTVLDVNSIFLSSKGVSFEYPCEKLTGWNYSILFFRESF